MTRRCLDEHVIAFQAVQVIYDKHLHLSEEEKLRKFSSTKVLDLIDLLKKSNAELAGGDKGVITSLVFVKMRQTAAGKGGKISPRFYHFRSCFSSVVRCPEQSCGN